MHAPFLQNTIIRPSTASMASPRFLGKSARRVAQQSAGTEAAPEVVDHTPGIEIFGDAAPGLMSGTWTRSAAPMPALVIAEIELQHELEGFEPPPWLGSEVNGQLPYYHTTDHWPGTPSRNGQDPEQWQPSVDEARPWAPITVNGCLSRSRFFGAWPRDRPLLDRSHHGRGTLLSI